MVATLSVEDSFTKEKYTLQRGKFSHMFHFANHQMVCIGDTQSYSTKKGKLGCVGFPPRTEAVSS